MKSMLPSPATERSWIDGDVLPHLTSQPMPYIVTILMTIVLAYSIWTTRLQKQPPILNPPRWFDIGGFIARKEFIKNGHKLLKSVSEQFPDKPVRIATDAGIMIVLPPNHLAEEIRNNPLLDLRECSRDDNHGGFPGFDPFDFVKTDGITPTIQNQLTKQLAKMMKPISTEATLALRDQLGKSSEWKEVSLAHFSPRFISALSSRIFLGDELCHNPHWREVTTRYTVRVFQEIKTLRMVPKLLRPLVHWFLPGCREVRQLLNEAREIIKPVIEHRNEQKRAAEREGRPIPSFDDAIEWAEQRPHNDQYDPAVFQITMSLASIHTTSHLLTHALQNIAPKPDLMDAMRKEIVEVIGKEGMTKRAMFRLRLIDSVLKETHRLRPTRMLTMNRIALEDVVLSDGTLIPKGVKCAVHATKRLDPTIYENPLEFDGTRFLRMRAEPHQANRASFVNTSTEALAFGYGMHACPGRFFAAAEMKIALAHLLMKYEFKPAEGYVSKCLYLGSDIRVDPESRIMVRRRSAEIDLDVL